ncbi:MAG: hypothetical protein U1C50_01830 [Patescibacteria group bacterium]|nr:hypothetical protein [Patescibacteria group bacterium]
MAENIKLGIELIFDQKINGPGTVEDLTRLDNPMVKVREFQGWLIDAFLRDKDIFNELVGGAHNKWEATKLPGKLDESSFPLRLATGPIRVYIGVNSMSGGVAWLDFVQPGKDLESTTPYLVVRVKSESRSLGARSSASHIRRAGLHRQKGYEKLLDLGLPLDVDLWQERDHPRMRQRVEDLLAMKPIVYINGVSTMEVATNDELLNLPGAIMRVNGVTRFYVADPDYQIEYKEAA